jgi:cytochrome c oxidase subunit 2
MLYQAELMKRGLKLKKKVLFMGQCSELCGIKHAFMPIEVRVVSEEDYQEWLTDAKVKFAKESN